MYFTPCSFSSEERPAKLHKGLAVGSWGDWSVVWSWLGDHRLINMLNIWKWISSISVWAFVGGVTMSDGHNIISLFTVETFDGIFARCCCYRFNYCLIKKVVSTQFSDQQGTGYINKSRKGGGKSAVINGHKIALVAFSEWVFSYF